MKMDEKYFLGKMHDVLVEFGEPATAVWHRFIPILHQIANDAAAEQRKKSEVAIRGNIMNNAKLDYIDCTFLDAAYIVRDSACIFPIIERAGQDKA